MNPDDESEFRAFVAARSPALLRTARLLTGNGHAAEDLVQDALARLVPRWRRVHDPEAYARTTMHRLQISRWRRLGVLREQPTERVDDVQPDAVPAHAGGTAAVDDRVVLTRALQRLTARQRGVLVCRYVEDLDEGQTAALLGISVGTVRSTAHRALARLREISPELETYRRDARRGPLLDPSEVTR